MGVLINRIKDWWLGADKTQKIVSIFGSLFLVVLLGFTAFFASKPKMVPLYAGLSLTDQAMVVDELKKKGIPVELGPQGAILVPSEKESEAKMDLASASKLPNPGPKGMEWLDSLNMSSTPAQEKEKIKAAKEGDLARNIMTLRGIESAIVQINFGKESAFSEEQIDPSAVVSIRESAGYEVTSEQARAIARLIQNSVAGLKPEKVSVINSTGRLVYDGEQQNSTEGNASKKLETERLEAKRRESDLQRRLDVAFGRGNTVAMVQVELNLDSITQDKTERELGDKKVTGETTEQMSDGAKEPPALGTTDPNAGAPASIPPPGSKSNYLSKSTTMDYPTVETRTSTKKAGGTLTAMTISVIANSTVVKDPAPIQSILNDYLGAKNGQQGFSASVQAVPFDVTAQEAEKKATQAAAGQSQTQQIISMLPIGALLLVGFMVAKALTKMPGRTLTMALPDGGVIQVPQGEFGESTTNPSLPSPEGTVTSVQELAQTEPELAKALEAMGIDQIDDTVDVEAIRQRIDLPLEQIRKMARQKPQAVAMLLKSWMLEERI